MSEKINIRLLVAYDGTDFFGWQKTKMGPSIESTLQEVLEQILQEKISLQAASRTDAGVHALGQVVNFFSSKKEIDLISLSKLLPKAISVLKVEIASDSFHPSVDALGKVYVYDICTGAMQLPQHRLYSWHYHYPLNLNRMKEAVLYLLGTYDFSAFGNVRKDERERSNICSLKRIDIMQQDKYRYRLEIEGDRFLYRMARNIAGTIAHVGRGKIRAEDVKTILLGKDRKLAGMAAPANGLTLQRVIY